MWLTMRSKCLTNDVDWRHANELQVEFVAMNAINANCEVEMTRLQITEWTRLRSVRLRDPSIPTLVLCGKTLTTLSNVSWLGLKLTSKRIYNNRKQLKNSCQSLCCQHQ